MKKHISIRSYILITILIMILLALASVFGVSYYVVKERIEEGRIEEIKNELDTLSERFAEKGIEGAISDKNLSMRVEDFAGIVSGRIMVISRDYQIVVDTSGESTGTLIINKNVMSVMTSEKDELIYKDSNTNNILVPIRQNGEVSGIIMASTSMGKILEGIKDDFTFVAFWV